VETLSTRYSVEIVSLPILYWQLLKIYPALSECGIQPNLRSFALHIKYVVSVPTEVRSSQVRARSL